MTNPTAPGMTREQIEECRKWRSNHTCTVVGSGTYRVKAGRKKYWKVSKYVRQLVEAHLGGDSPTSKSGISVKRPTYTIEMSPAQQYRSPWDCQMNIEPMTPNLLPARGRDDENNYRT